VPVNEDQLRQLLAERSDPARHRPAPQERIAARIRRARMKRAAGAGLLAVAVAAGVVSGVTLAHEHAPGHAPSYSGRGLPDSFTASDGAAYRRLAATSMTDPAQRSVSLAVQAGSDPVDVMAACDAPRSNAFIDVKVNGADAGVIVCQDSPQLIGLPVRPGRTAHLTFFSTSALGFPPGKKISWRLAAYSWTPPATIRPAPAAPRLPRSYPRTDPAGGQGMGPRHLLASRSGDWPGDRTGSFTVTYHGRQLDISLACAGAVGGQLQVSIRIEGSSQELSCSQTSHLSTTGGAGQPVTVTFRIQAPSPYAAADYAKRAASWTIAAYDEQK
jgi:lipoprotein-anchoring transpeptidase ErfK/SrfK